MSEGTRIGALLRAYSSKLSGVNAVVNGIDGAVRRLKDAGIADIQIGIWADKDNPAADCGATNDALCLSLARLSSVHIHKTVNGDLFVTILNEGIEKQHDRGLTHSLILSWEAASYVDSVLVAQMRQAVVEGALVVGIALPEIAEFVCKGAVMNTLALWDIKELIKVGKFDKRDTKPRYTNHYAESNAGVGEFIPLLKLVERYARPVLAVIRPTQQGIIEVPADRLELQRKKLESKYRRIDGMLKEIGKTSDDLRATIMPGYPS